MNSEVIIDVQPRDISIALLEDKRLAEFQREERSEHYSVGNIYLAKVKKVMPGLNACFVNVGHEKDAFLHYLDLGPRYRCMEKFLELTASDGREVQLGKAAGQPETGKDGSIQDVLKAGQDILVQIEKEPINTKGPRLTCEISFAGRFLVLIPFGEKINVSTKIKSSSERARLKQLVSSIKPKHFGVIVRTVAEGLKAGEIDQEMRILISRWDDMVARIRKARGRKQKLPQICYEEQSRTVALLRDLFNPSYDGIYVNDQATYEEIRSYVALIAPEKEHIVKFYRGGVPIFDNYNVAKQIKTGLGRIVTAGKGAYLVIEHTEALHVVDVNSGNRSKLSDGQENSALDSNLAAADELARQLRLRDMGGIIVVDFIDMELPENRQKLYERMTENMRRDRARHNILPLSKFGLMQITRQRVRPSTDFGTAETCPCCHGTGQISASLLYTDQLEREIEYLAQTQKVRRFTLQVHPYVYAYINQGLVSMKLRWQMHYTMGLTIVPNQMLAYLEHRFLTPEGDPMEVKLNTPARH